jgi:hypothetical protein
MRNLLIYLHYAMTVFETTQFIKINSNCLNKRAYPNKHSLRFLHFIFNIVIPDISPLHRDVPPPPFVRRPGRTMPFIYFSGELASECNGGSTWNAENVVGFQHILSMS